MATETETEITIDQAERIAVLETEFAAVKQDLKDIKTKLDDLLHLKSKGMGALGLVTLLISSGVVGLIVALTNMFKTHL